MTTRPRIVFMGTPDFAVRSLEACLELGEVVAVVCQPDKPKGRGQALAMPPVKALALAHRLPVLQPVKIRGTDFAHQLGKLEPTVAVVTAYGKILPPDVLAVPPLGCVNVHASLLPRFRGAAPIQWAIASGDRETGVCLMKMDEGMDTGPVLACARTPILPTDTGATLHDRLAQLGYEVLKQELPRYLAGELHPRPQPSTGVVLAPMLKKEDGRLDFTRPAEEQERRLRAFTPWPGAFTTFHGQLLKVREARVENGKGPPGAVLSLERGIEVACGEGSLVMSVVQPEGKRAMSAPEFLAGRQIAVGSTPFGS